MRYYSFAGAMALLVLVAAQAEDVTLNNNASPQVTPEERKTIELFRSFSQCVYKKKEEIRDEAIRMVDTNPAQIEDIVKHDGRMVGLTQESIERQISFFRSMNIEGKREWAADYLIWIKNPRGVCIKDLNIDIEGESRKLSDVARKYGSGVLPMGP